MHRRVGHYPLQDPRHQDIIMSETSMINNNKNSHIPWRQVMAESAWLIEELEEEECFSQNFPR